MLHLAPPREAAALVRLAVEPGECEEILAFELRVVIHERLFPLDTELFEEVPQLHHVREAAAIVVCPLANVAVQRLLRLVEELVETAHRGVSRVLRHPRFHLLEYGEVRLVHLAVGLVAQRADEHAAERVQVQPGEDVRVFRGELEDGPRLRRAPRDLQTEEGEDGPSVWLESVLLTE